MRLIVLDIRNPNLKIKYMINFLPSDTCNDIDMHLKMSVKNESAHTSSRHYATS